MAAWNPNILRKLCASTNYRLSCLSKAVLEEKCQKVYYVKLRINTDEEGSLRGVVPFLDCLSGLRELALFLPTHHELFADIDLWKTFGFVFSTLSLFFPHVFFCQCVYVVFYSLSLYRCFVCVCVLGEKLTHLYLKNNDDRRIEDRNMDINVFSFVKLPCCISLSLVDFRLLIPLRSENYPSLRVFRFMDYHVAVVPDHFKDHPNLEDVQFMSSIAWQPQIPNHLLSLTTLLYPTMLPGDDPVVLLAKLTHCSWTSPYLYRASRLAHSIPNMEHINLTILGTPGATPGTKEVDFDFENVGLKCPLIESLELNYRKLFDSETARHLRSYIRLACKHFKKLRHLRVFIHSSWREHSWNDSSSGKPLLSTTDLKLRLDEHFIRKDGDDKDHNERICCDNQALCRLVFLMRSDLPVDFHQLVFNNEIFSRYEVECGALKREMHYMKRLDCSIRL